MARFGEVLDASDFAKRPILRCDMGRFALQYRPYQNAKRPFSQGEKGRFVAENGAFWGLFLLHNKAYKTYKSYRTNRLRLHTHIARICARGGFAFKKGGKSEA